MAKSFVIVKIAAADGLGQDRRLAGLEGVRGRFPGHHFEPVYESLSAMPGAPGARLGQYFQVAIDSDAAADELVNALKGSGLVVNAYVRGHARLARGRDARLMKGNRGGRNGARGKNGVHMDPPLEEKRLQPYLRAGTIGVNAYYAWDNERTRGQNVRVADIEEGWDLAHVDLPHPMQAIGSNRLEAYSHGLAVLGILIARDSQTGLIGIAPRAEAIPISYFRDNDNPFDIGWAIDQALDPRYDAHLQPGDILLLEAEHYQKSPKDPDRVPVEIDEHIFEAISVLTERDILVIEPAGNAGIDLDGKALEEWRAWGDSGALMVSGTRQEGLNKTHLCQGASCNWGTRVDCYAWGEGIRTLGSEGDKDPPEGVTMFSGTSGASAIIAGAAALLQSIARRQFNDHKFGKDNEPWRDGSEIERKYYLTPKELRDFLKDPLTGTVNEDAKPKDKNERPYPIGVMPDLEKVIAAFYVKYPPSPTELRRKTAAKRRRIEKK